MARVRPGFFAAGALLLLPTLLVPLLAVAAQVQTLPSQQIPELRRSPPPITRQPGDNLTIPPRLPSQGSTREIPLPQVFRGCWTGTVPGIDSLQPLSPDIGYTIWLTKIYTLCYKQVGYNGKWQLTFAEGTVENRREVTDQRSTIKVKSVIDSNHVELTAYLHFRSRPFANFWGAARGSTVDELTHLKCRIIPGRDLMAVSAVVFVEHDGEPDANITWHTNFSRTRATTTPD
jgi:hypothetical protein